MKANYIHRFFWGSVILGAGLAVTIAFQNCDGPQAGGLTDLRTLSSDGSDGPVNCSNTTTYLDCSNLLRVPATFLENGCAQFACSGDAPLDDPVEPELKLCDANAGFPTCGIGEQLITNVINDCLDLRCEPGTDDTNAAFINGLYQTWFGRDPDSAGFDYWVDQLRMSTRDRVVLDFLNSPITSDQAYVLANRREQFIMVHTHGDERGPRDLPQWFVEATTDLDTPLQTACNARPFENGQFSETQSFAVDAAAIVPVVVARVYWMDSDQTFRVYAACNKQRRRCTSDGRWAIIDGEMASPTGVTLERSLTLAEPDVELKLNAAAEGACHDAVELRSMNTCGKDVEDCTGDFNLAPVFSRSDYDQRVAFVRGVYTEWFGRTAEIGGTNYWAHHHKDRSEARIRCDIVRGARDSLQHQDLTYVQENRADDLAALPDDCSKL